MKLQQTETGPELSAKYMSYW